MKNLKNHKVNDLLIGQVRTFLPEDKILNPSIFEAVAETNSNIAQLLWCFISQRVENFMGKGENAGYQHFLLFP